MTPADLLPALPWALPYLTLFRLARRHPRLDDYPAERGRLLSVIIPARNEAATIETVLGSVRQTDYTPVEIIVVDDRSTDDTAARVSRLAQVDSRIRLVAGAELPSGWFGKPWACLQGFHVSRGELVVFVDADTRHQPSLLAHAAGAQAATGADLLTVMPHQLCVSFWERVVMPLIWFLLAVRFHPEVVNRARHARDLIANGQFMFFTRQSYQAAGTHEAVRAEVAEDLALAQTCFRSGGKVFFAFAESLMETRMYRDLRGMVEGWSKNMYLGARRSLPDEPILRALVPLLLLAGVLFGLLPPVALGLGLAGVGAAWLAPAAVACGLQAVFWAVVCRGMRVPLWYGLLYPLGYAVSLFIVLRSVTRGAGRVEWRGRTYGVAAPRN